MTLIFPEMAARNKNSPPPLEVGQVAHDRLLLFAHISDICYFVKDKERRFVAANEALLQLLSLRSTTALLGKTDHELIPAYLADAYEKDDVKVISHGVSITNKIELVTHNDLSVYWYTTTKVPLRDPSGAIIGLEGITREFSPASSAMGPYPELFKLIDLIDQRYAEKLTVSQMAKISGMSVRTFERRFKERFHTSPFAYLKKVRINAACRELIQTNHPLADISLTCGFCDQSYMTKEFARIMKTTPQAYRLAHIGVPAQTAIIQ